MTPKPENNSGKPENNGGTKQNSEQSAAPDSPKEEPPKEEPKAEQPEAIEKPDSIEEVEVANTSLFNSGVGPVGALLALVGLATAGLTVGRRVWGKSSIRGEPTPDNGAAERAAAASADAVGAFSEARVATKTASGASGGGEGAAAETTSDPETQPADTGSDPVLLGWVPGMPIRLLVADDQPDVRSELRDALESQPDFDVIGEATTGAEAVDLTDQLHPRVVLTDLHMPEVDGVVATAQIKAEHQDTYVVILTNNDSDADIPRALEAGATDYLLEDAPREEFFETIRAAAQGKTAHPGHGSPPDE